MTDDSEFEYKCRYCRDTETVREERLGPNGRLGWEEVVCDCQLEREEAPYAT